MEKPKKPFASKLRRALALLTGADVIARTVADTASVTAGSLRRTADLVKRGRQADEQPLPEFTGSETERFAASMRHFNVNEAQLARMVCNSALNFWLCVALFGLAVAVGGWSLHHYPPETVFTVPFRFLPLPILAVLVFKYAFYNWLYRHRRLDTATAFFKSHDLLPRMSAP